MSITRVDGGVCAPKGFVAGGLHCGIRKNVSKKDLAVILSKTPCAAAAVYTQNKVYGAPITVTRANLQNGVARAVVCNSGNANTCNADGVEIAERMCALTADALGIDPTDVIIASTGVIGQPLNLTPIARGIDLIKDQLSVEGARGAAEAIMTTDLAVKELAVSVPIGGVPVTLGAIAKGSGMIHPNMATMLSFITTDAKIDATMLQNALSQVVTDTYNMISVDGDTSTNDMVSIMANGEAGNPPIVGPGPGFDAFKEALFVIASEMARLIAADGEGATKLIECRVTGAPNDWTARVVAKSVITSNLFKAAMFGADANWGRILCAIGYADADFAIESIDVALSSPAGSVSVCQNGAGRPFSEDEAKRVLSEKEITVSVDMKQGASKATAWGCDLSYEYVRINGDYRS